MAGFYGWAGTILNVDLTSGKVEKKALDPDFARKFLGASGFNSATLFDLVPPEIDALSPDNVIMFGVGPLSGTLAQGSARLTVTAKSPLTDIFGDSNMGGFFAAELKFAGYDQVVIHGKAKGPVYLWIADDEVRLIDASHLWGRSTWETARIVKEELGDPEIQVVCIGQAGENLVRMANIICPTKRAAGRTGMGAVMGSKNLKAIAVRGSKAIAVARPGEFIRTCHETRQHIVEKYPEYEDLHEHGTPGIFDRTAPFGMLGVRNWQGNVFPNWQALSGKTLKRDFVKSMRACSACHIACGPFHSITSGEFAGVYGEGPEYAFTESALLMGIDSLPAALKFNELMNQYGLDIYSLAGVFAWAMECYQRGIFTSADFDGTPLSWGDYGAVIEMIPKVANRKGFGNILAEGEKRASQLVGRGSQDYMHHVKGLALIALDPRSRKQTGLGLLTSTRGADHLKASRRMADLLSDTDLMSKMRSDPGKKDINNPEAKGVLIKWCQDMVAVVNASGICTRTGGSIQLLSSALSSATGVDFSIDELAEIGERIVNLQKAFNSRQGLTRKDDDFSVSKHFTQEPIPDGPFKGSVFERDAMLDEYYEARDWDCATGLQTREKLEKLGLGYVVAPLEKVGAIRQTT